jgi:hypothetical protein
MKRWMRSLHDADKPVEVSAIDFYKRTFGADELFRREDDNRAVVARLSVNRAEFWHADESPEHSHFSPESPGGRSGEDSADRRRPGRHEEMSALNHGHQLIFTASWARPWHLIQVTPTERHILRLWPKIRCREEV